MRNSTARRFLPATTLVKCDTTGSTAQVKFVKNGKEIASATGQVKQLANAPDHNQVVTQDGNGSSTISEIDFSNSKTGVTFDSGTSYVQRRTVVANNL
jgi:hypothetical protein